MANGTDSEHIVESIRTGLKREFTFAMKSQSEICSSLGRTRSNRTQNLVQVSNGSTQKRVKRSGSFGPKCKTNEDATHALSENEGKSYAKSEVADESTNFALCENESKMENEGLMNVVYEININKHKPKYAQPVCDNGGFKEKEEDDNGSILDHKLKAPKTFMHSTMNKFENDDNNVKSNDSENKRRGDVVASTREKISMGFAEKKFPSKLKDLLSSGILEGLLVKYIRGVKAKSAGLLGVISGVGVLCHCDICNEVEVVTPTIFELHAGSTNKRPPEYIFLENGHTLRKVMNTFLDFPLDTVEEAVQKILGDFTMRKSKFCVNCRDVNVVSRLFCNSCVELLKDCQSNLTPSNGTSDISVSIQSRSKKSNTSQAKSQGRLTRKDLRLHKLVFDEGGLPDGTEVGYYIHGKNLLTGYKKGFGIVCSCCNSQVSPSQFEAHAGWASRRKPYVHILVLSSGVSLHDLSISLSKGRKFSTNDNDDLCSICREGGKLLCCDACPRAFHLDCVPLPSVPNHTWYCKYCQNLFQKSKYVKHNENALVTGRSEDIDPVEQINQRCIRVVQEFELGGCVLCRGQDFSKEFGPRTVIICDQCEKEFHIGCLKDHNIEDLKELPEGNWFCCSDCDNINTTLVNLVDCGEQNLPNSLTSLIKKKYNDKGLGFDFDIKWRVLNWKVNNTEDTRQLLSKVVALFHDRFDPIVHATTGIDYIPTMLFGRNIKGEDFSGMYCVLLTVNQVVVSAGIFRVFGTEMAELPLVATVTNLQGLGYFQSLFYCIESLLGSLKVKQFVLPAAGEAEAIWTSKFGFTKLDEDEINNYWKYYRMMIFQGTSLLHKQIPTL